MSIVDVVKDNDQKNVDEAKLQRDKMIDVIKDEDVYYIETAEGRLLRAKPQEFTKILHFCTSYGILNRKEFEMTLRALNRVKVRLVNTFGIHSPNEFNLMSKDGWIDKKYIVAGELSELTIALLNSLGGGDPVATEHIMHWIGWKYLHPGDFMLPALSIFGEQNVGKGVLSNRILPTIFGKKQVFHAGSEDIIGSFNAHAIFGKSIVCVDESNLSAKSDNRLKQLIGNPTVQAHAKGLTPITVDNCIAYLFTSNDLFGGIKLDSNVKSNRRFSMIEANKTLQYWIEKAGLDWDKIMQKDVIKKHFSDPVEIGKLLWLCIELAKDKGRPEALKNAVLLELIEAQNPLNGLFEDVFLTEQVKWITSAELHERCLEEDAAGYDIKKQKLTRELKKWARTNVPNLKSVSKFIQGKTLRGFAVE